MADFIVTTNLDHLDDNAFMKRSNDLIKYEEDNPLVFPDLAPKPSVERILWDETNLLLEKRDIIVHQLKGMTEQIHKNSKTMKADLRAWASQAENTAGVTKEKVKTALFGIKGEDDQHGDSPVSVNNSLPVITKVVSELPLHLTVYVENDKTHQVTLPDDAANLDLYMGYSEADVKDPKKRIHLGRVRYGKFVAHFDASDLNKDVWFGAIYEPKHAGATPELSGSIKGKVI
jgi:hypothetical protein